MILFYFLISVMPFSDPPVLHHLTGDATFRLLGALCGLYALFYLGKHKGLPGYFATWQSRFVPLFYLIATASLLTRSLRPLTESPWVTCTSFLILFFVTRSVVDSLQRLQRVLISAAVAVAFGSTFVILEWIRFRNIYADFRPGYSVGDSNYFASAAILILPFIFLRSVDGEAGWEKWFYPGTLLVAAVALTLCASRGGFVGLIVAFLVLLWRSRHGLQALLIIVLLLLLPALALPNSPVRRLLQPTHSEQESNQNRIMAWKAGWRMVQAHPVFGVGLGNFKEMMPRYADPGATHENIAHNSYLEVAAEMGTPQLLIFVAILFFSFRSFEQARRETERSGPKLIYQVALGLEAGLTGHAVAALTLSAEYQKLFWLVLCISMCLPERARALDRGTQSSHSGSQDPILVAPERQPAIESS